VLPNEIFKREGNNLICDLELTFVEASLGCEKIIKTLTDNQLKLKIPAGTQYGSILRFKGYGVLNINTKETGDLNVRIVIKTPTNLTSRQKELLQEFQAEYKKTPTMLQ
jgi:molecular chaperone DnaJ